MKRSAGGSGKAPRSERTSRKEKKKRDKASEKPASSSASEAAEHEQMRIQHVLAELKAAKQQLQTDENALARDNDKAGKQATASPKRSKSSLVKETLAAAVEQHRRRIGQLEAALADLRQAQARHYAAGAGALFTPHASAEAHGRRAARPSDECDLMLALPMSVPFEAADSPEEELHVKLERLGTELEVVQEMQADVDDHLAKITLGVQKECGWASGELTAGRRAADRLRADVASAAAEGKRRLDKAVNWQQLDHMDAEAERTAEQHERERRRLRALERLAGQLQRRIEHSSAADRGGAVWQVCTGALHGRHAAAARHARGSRCVPLRRCATGGQTDACSPHTP